MATINTVLNLKDNFSQPLARATKGLDSFSGKIITLNSALNLISQVKGVFAPLFADFERASAELSQESEMEAKLEAVMRSRMGATDETIDSMKEYIDTLSKTSIYSKAAYLSGAQELASYVENAETVKEILPSLADMTAQSKGLGASTWEFMQYATMMGKVLGGDTGGMTKRGYQFSDSENEIIKTGTEMQKVEVIAKNVSQSIGNQVEALASTGAGQAMIMRNAYLNMLKPVASEIKGLQSQIKSFSTAFKVAFLSNMSPAIGKFTSNLKANMSSVIAGFLRIGAVGVLAATAVGIAWMVANWQITLVMLAVISLAKAIGDGIFQYKRMESEMEASNNILIESFKILGGVIGAVGGLFGGLIAIASNCIKTLINIIFTAINFIANLFTNPIRAFASLVLDLASLVLGVVQNLVGAIDYILPTHLSEGIGKASKFIAEQKKALQKDENLDKMGGKWVGFDLLETSSVEGPWSMALKGMGFGEKLGAGVADALNFGMDYAKQQKMFDELKTGLDANTKSLDANTKGGEKTLAIEEEYKRLLAEKAMQEFQVKYANTNVTPQVNISAMNIANGVDEDRVILRIASGLEQARSNSLMCVGG